MGYITNYHLDAYDGDEPVEYDQWKQLVNNITDKSLSNDNLLLDIYTDEGVNCKWFKHYEYMVKLSLYFPTFTFVITGEGEEHDDYWSETWKNGARLSYNAEAIMGKSLIRWLKTKDPALYAQFKTEFAQGEHRANDHADFKISSPLRPQIPWPVNNNAPAGIPNLNLDLNKA